MGTPRDYYADLDLPPSADVQEIKKQFRKLALKYHPDRNPGREAEVNSQFQVIQSAHEVLTDPEQKAKYDATRGRSRYPASSGVKGNPWSNVSAQYPPPPRRNQSTRAQPSAQQPSGAQRWQTRFSSGVPPTAKQSTGADPEAKKNAARAFENMRKGASGAPRPPPPPPPPRTESARQRAQAAFGARKSGYQPRSAMSSDEPPVTSSNYTTRPDPERFTYTAQEPRRPAPTMPDPLSQFRDQEIPMETRQRTPYMSHGGEKTNPFDGIPLSRAKSTRETSHTRREETYSSDEGLSFRQRSSSAADASSPKTPQKGAPKQPSTTEKPRSDRPKAPLKKTRTNPGFMADQNFAGTTASNGPATELPKASEHYDDSKTQTNSSDGPSMYATPPCFKHQQSPSLQACVKCGTYHAHGLSSLWKASHKYDASCQYVAANGSPYKLTPSGVQNSPIQLTSFERQQHNLLARLISNVEAGVSSKKKTFSSCNSGRLIGSDNADNSFSYSFNFGVNDDTFAQASPDKHRFARSSTDDINTSFVDDEDSNTWQFSAGGGDDAPPVSRSQSGSRTGRRSPNKRPALHRVDTPNAPSESGKSDGGFNPEGWSDKFGPQTFVPQPPQAASASPTRSSRANSRRPKTAKAVPGGGTVVDDSSSDDELFEWRGRKAQTEPVVAESPQAMDIDSPPAGTPIGASAGVSTAPSPSPQPNGARNIHVEPSRPEWRPGNVEAVNTDTESNQPTEATKPAEPTVSTDATKDFNPNAVGSEDSEEFRASFADLKNVAPFAQQDDGLKSFTDMKNTLPFDSKPSAKLPIKIPKPPPLQFPRVPTAPTLPATVFISGLKPNTASWENYVKEFETYLRNWDAFNGQVADHFSTRKTNIAKSREAEGYAFLENRDDSAIQEYCNWVQQDIDVRRQWAEACEDHQRRLREFMAFRLKMK